MSPADNSIQDVQSEDPRRYAPAAARNRDPIWAAVAPHLPAPGSPPGKRVLEIASGTGEHIAHFATRRPDLLWQPSDPDAERRRSIDAHAAGRPNIRPALALDVAADPWPIDAADAILAINLIHIAPWSVAEALFRGAARLLPPGGLLALYGPYRRRDRPLEPGNAAFDADLRARNPAWGLRDLDTVLEAAEAFTHTDTLEMPANNLTLILHRA